MRYLICKNNISNEEVTARIKYIYDIFHVYTLKSSKESNKEITVLKSVPDNQPDILMLIGHDPITNNYIIKNINKIPEKNIVVLSCNTKKIRKSIKKLKNKNKFEFDITDEEVILYRNRKENIEKMILKAFERIE